MIQVADNFNYRGKKPNFDRDSFDTLQDMKNYSENSLDDGHISYCKETNKHYKFNSNNQSDPTTGKLVEQHEAVPADEEDITEQNGTLDGTSVFDTDNIKPTWVYKETWYDSNGNPAYAEKTGTQYQRPANVKMGFYYFDTSLNKPIWKNSDTENVWIDATGATV